MNDIDILALVLAAGLAAVFAYVLGKSAMRMLRHDGRLRLSEMLRARGLQVPAPQSEADLVAAALATRRCVTCHEQNRCDVALAERDWKRLDELCPNRDYVAGRAVRSG